MGSTLKKAKHVTCIEISEKMISRSTKRLIDATNVSYVPMFAQDYRAPTKYDVAICSLVLMHNTDDTEYEKLVESLCDISDRVYIAEDVTEGRMTSPFTKIRSRYKICQLFDSFGFVEEKESAYKLDVDDVTFIIFIRKIQ